MNEGDWMKRFEFTGLRTLHKDMMKKGEERATFPFEFNGKTFSCIFLTDIIPYRLYLSSLGFFLVVFDLVFVIGFLVFCGCLWGLLWWGVTPLLPFQVLCTKSPPSVFICFCRLYVQVQRLYKIFQAFT